MIFEFRSEILENLKKKDRVKVVPSLEVICQLIRLILSLSHNLRITRKFFLLLYLRKSTVSNKYFQKGQVHFFSVISNNLFVFFGMSILGVVLSLHLEIGYSFFFFKETKTVILKKF